MLNQISDIIFDILTYGIFFYSVLLLFSYLLIGIYSIGETRKYILKNRFTDYRVLAASVHAPTVSILAPAYNEGKNIVENVRSLLSIYYANLEVIIINDGSKDDTMDQLISAYDLYRVYYFVNDQLPAKPVRGIYKSRNSVYKKLLVVDKENGGKADALNLGINVSSNNYLVCIDVDCVLEQDALLKMVKPFLEQTDKKVIASGGVIRVANSCVIEDGRLVKVKLAQDYLPRIQILEYIRAFILGRMAWSRLNGLMLISGAFGAFDKEIAIKAGGYNHNTVGEDMELVVRMRRYMEEIKEDYKVTYIPDPLCWTEVPSNYTILGRQRNRWIRGTYETLNFHKIMFFNPRYRLLGMLSYPYWFFFELCAPIIEFFGFIFFFIFAWTGYLDWEFFFAFFLFITCFAYLYSSFAILMEVLTFNQYKRRVDILRLMLTGLTEPFYFHPFVVWSAIKGYLDLIKRKKGWGEMTRQGLSQRSAAPTVTSVPVFSTPSTGVTETTTVVPVQYDPEPEKKTWVMERTVIPALSTFVRFISASLKSFLNRAIVLYILLVLTRVLELIYDNFQHGTPKLIGMVMLTGFTKDLIYFLQCMAVVFPIFAVCYLIHKKLAQFFFIIMALLVVLIQVSLAQYFITTLVPLGGDLWGYSMADIKQTVGASGSLNVTTGLIFGALLALIISSLIIIPKRLYINGLFRFLFFLALLLSVTTAVPDKVYQWMPGQEYSNNLSINKSAYFFKASYDHFFPQKQETDIYSNSYSGDFTTSEADAQQYTFRYVDEKNFPFLHITDSTQDVLTPFFKTGKTPPNIVILLVEGLGRAFTNKGAYLGNFTPFVDSLSDKSLYWENFLSEGGRTFAVLPSLLASLPFAKNGFNELGANMPKHLSLLNILGKNGYNTSFYYGGDAHFDNMDLFLEKNDINKINDEKTFPAGYTKMPSVGSFTWGYGDKELFRRYFETKANVQQPYLSVLLTVSTHSPFEINEQEYYLQRFEQRLTQLSLSEDLKNQYRKYSKQYASILFTDDALRNFFSEYSKRPDFANTVFLITGDHRMPEIPMSSKLDRYHVPLIMYSPMLSRTTKFSSISTHFDITPSLLAWLGRSYHLQTPSLVSWMGSGLDTVRQFRNIHSYPIMQTKTDIIDYVMGDYQLNNNDLFAISANMGLEQEKNEAKSNQMRAAFDKFRNRNQQFLNTLKILPDSLLQKYTRH